MLEFLGFIALISIIFGVSFATALDGFLKFIAIGIALIVALGLIVKMLESKNGTVFLIVASGLALVIGVPMINDDIIKRSSYCNTGNWSIDSYCYAAAADTHNETVNKGWAYSICGAIIGLIAIASYENKNKIVTPKTYTPYAE